MTMMTTETVTDHVWAICEPLTEAQAVLDDYMSGGKVDAERTIESLHRLLSEPALLRAMWEVGYFPSTTPPAPVVGLTTGDVAHRISETCLRMERTAADKGLNTLAYVLRVAADDALGYASQRRRH